MKFLTYEERMKELQEKVERYGLDDLRKLAPIGDLGYANGWKSGSLQEQIVKAAREQGFQYEGNSTGYRLTDHHTYYPEIDLTYHVDSGD